MTSGAPCASERSFRLLIGTFCHADFKRSSCLCLCPCRVSALGLAIKNCPDDAQRYLAEGSAMRTVVLQVSDEEELLKLKDRLTERQIGHELWQEEPEKMPTALASVPIRKSAGKVFKGLKLLS